LEQKLQFVEDHFDDVISYVVKKGSGEDLARLHHRLPHLLTNLNDESLKLIEASFHEYVEYLHEVNRDGIFPFDFVIDNPNSVMSTALALSRMLEFDLLDDPLSNQIINQLLFLLNDKGWWRDTDEITNVENLPFYQDPSNASVRIFNTTFTSSVLAHINTSKVEESLRQVDAALSKITSSNGIIPGFPQSNWFATKLIARIYGLESSRFLLHWSVLSDLVDKINDSGSLASIAENLIEAGVPRHDPLIMKCKKKIRASIETSSIDGTVHQGWSDTSNTLDTSISLRCLIVLQDKDDQYLSKYKIE
jgi:hypothetical protein